MAKRYGNYIDIGGRLVPISTDKVTGTDTDGGVIGEKGEDGMKVWNEYLKSHPEAKKDFEDNIHKGIASDAIYFQDL